MTREEAIQALTGYAGIGGTYEPSCDVTFRANILDFDEAMGMAVAALREQEERGKCEWCAKWKSATCPLEAPKEEVCSKD